MRPPCPARYFADKCCLLVLDDVWQVTDAEVFTEVLGERCRMLVTSRDAGLVNALGANDCPLDTLTDEAALELLGQWAELPRQALPAEAVELATKCGRLPLALATCAAMARDGTPWTELLGALREADVAFLKKRFAWYAYPSVAAAIQVSVGVLARADAEAAACYRELRVFAPGQPLPETTVVGFWRWQRSLSERDARQLLVRLDRLAMLRLSGEAPARRVLLHDLQHDYLQLGQDLPVLHARLLERYRQEMNNGWMSVPDDGYLLANLPHHLISSGRQAEWRALAKVMEPTFAFEGYGFDTVIGNIDRSGIIWGVLGFSLKNGDLSGIVLEVEQHYPELLKRSFGGLTEELLNVLRSAWSEQQAWADRISTGTARREVSEPWRSAFRDLGRSPEVQGLQLRYAYRRFLVEAVDLARKYGLSSELGVALCFDIRVLLGGIRATARKLIEGGLKAAPPESEEDLRRLMAISLADAVSPRFRDHVRRRLLAVATGSGMASRFGLSEKPW